MAISSLPLPFHLISLASYSSGVGNIFISNLHKDIDHKTLHDTFARYGNILSSKVSLDASGKSRGYGFVHFATEQEAKEAIQRLNGAMLQGQSIRVFAFKTKQERQRELELNFLNVFVKNVPSSWNTEKLNQVFGKFGAIKRSTVRARDDGVSKEYGFVEFETHEAAKSAVEQLNDLEVEDGRKLIVMRAQKKSERMELLKRGILPHAARKHEVCLSM